MMRYSLFVGLVSALLCSACDHQLAEQMGTKEAERTYRYVPDEVSEEDCLSSGGQISFSLAGEICS